MGTKNKRKRQKRAKDKDKHPRRCQCEECTETRDKRKWNKRKIKIARDVAKQEKENLRIIKDTNRPGFLAGGHPKLKRDFTFEPYDPNYYDTDALTPLHANARRFIRIQFPKGKVKDADDKYVYPYNPFGDHKLWRAYQMDIGTEKFDAVTDSVDTDLMFHGTGFANITNIGHNNLEVRGSWCLLGAGIYLAPSFGKAWGFSGYHRSLRTVLLCATKLGKVLDSKNCVTHIEGCDKVLKRRSGLWGKLQCNPKCKWHKPNAQNVRNLGFDSAAANRGYHPGAHSRNLLHTEYCSYDSARVLPLYVLVFSNNDGR
ncbi:MAG: hypothetical protein ACXABY_17905 [Candidatus Thorarchaeota archaeon]|jgi:hypothetical protein